MNFMRCASRLATIGLLGLLTACQSTSQSATSAAVPALTPMADNNAGLLTIPGCADGGTATLAGGVHISYLGADPDDSQRCLLQWSGRSHALYFGFWSPDPRTPMGEEARAALRAALMGPVGTEASFETRRARLWS